MIFTLSQEAKHALDNNLPVVALESTIIAHGMPFPQNVNTAKAVEQIVRDCGATPATIAVLQGEIKVGLTEEEIILLGSQASKVAKLSRRDLPIAVARKLNGATTVSTTMLIAHSAGIKVFATGGIGGVHRDAESTMDISADLQELAHTPVMVVCSGAKSILDIPKTLEYLETSGVTVCGYNTEFFPAFYLQSSGLGVDCVVDEQSAAKIFYCARQLGYSNGMVVGVPVPSQYAADEKQINTSIEAALKSAKEKNIKGKQVTPYLLQAILNATDGASLTTNIALIKNNARVASLIAVSLTELYD